MFRSALLLLPCLIITLSATGLAQGTRSDYERSAKLSEQTRNKVAHAKVEPHWFGTDNNHFWYRRELTAKTHEFVVIDAAQGSRQPAFDHEQLAAALSQKLGKKIESDRLDLQQMEFAEDGESIRFNAGGKGWRYAIKSNELADAELLKSDDAQPQDRPRRGGGGRARSRGEESPDGQKAVAIRNHNLVLRYKPSGNEITLSTDGTADDPYESGVVWSPDSLHFVALKTRRPETHTVYLVESSPKDQLQPKLHSFDYLKPGDRIAHPRVCLFDVPTESEEVASASSPSNQPNAINDQLFPNPWSIDEIRWASDSSRFTFAYNQRGHQVLRIIAVDAQSRAATSIINEESPTFIDYAGKRFVDYVDDAHEIIWMSERSGWNHLYLYDSATGSVKNPITQGEWVVRGVDHVDEDHRQITFKASGVFTGQDPYYIHVGRINFDGSGLTWLTAGDGTHTIDYSPDRQYLVDTYSRVDQPPITELRKVADGSLICEVDRGDWSELLATGWKAPERFTAKGRDGTTDIFGVIWRPTNFDEAKKYPVIEYIYAGPHSAFTPKSFVAYHGVQSMAELGFVVVQLDGMGTSHRSKAFHDVCWKNLGDSGFPDRIKWIKAAAEKYPQLDIKRVGIYGGSAGGQSSTRAVLAHGDFYKAAVSDCGCHDNRMDKIWWNELWMGYPIGDHYAAQSNVTNADKLTGKLMLVVGELDRNVDPASTMQVANALIKADKDFDLLIIPGAGHGAAESPYGKRRRMDFFVRHLLDVEPRSTP
ncbi:MAG: dipeptidyl aminopeptidase/acylaminoacyl peptidase [Schlesneria sp.]|nr:dipeptidyl aminopeptidase/acylaminoacyl peptidase [Schlesneria sp.]